MADKRFPEGAFLPDGQPNIPSQAYVDYLKEINPMMVPVADPEGYVAPPRDTSEKPFSNYAFDKAFDTATGAGRSFKNAFTGQGVAQLMPKMQFYPGGPTGAEKIYGGAADVGLGVLSTALAGLEAGAGFIAERVPFQNENQEDRLSRDLLGGIEFLEQYTAPYLGLFSKIGRASKAATTANRAANRAPEPPVAVAPEPEITIAPTLSGGTSLTDAITAAQAAERANRLPDELTDAEMDAAFDDIIQEETDPEVLINNALLEREATGATFTPEDDQLLNDLAPDDVVQPINTDWFNGGMEELVARNRAAAFTREDDQLLNDLELTDADFSEIDEANTAYDRVLNERIDVALDSSPEYQDPSVRLDVQNLRESGQPPRVIEEYLAGIKKDQEPVYQISDARYADQLRDLYERNNLPIPKNNAEERAADLIIQVAAGEDVSASLRRDVDLDYLKANAPEEVFNQAKPTIQETLETERQYGVLNDINVDQDTDIGALTGAFGFYNKYPPTFSPSMEAAERLPQERGAYNDLKKWMLKNGAKAKELEWSGADEAFEGRTDVTKNELIQYLNENKDLVEAERKVAYGILREEGGDTRMAEEDYINSALDSEIEEHRNMFLENWQYNNNMESIDDYVASENMDVLNRLINQIDGIDTVEELIERFPEGYIDDRDPLTGFRRVFEDADEASEFDLDNNAPFIEEDARQSLREHLDDMEAYDPEQYGRMIFGDDAAPADTSELEYTKYFPSGGTDTAETTYQFRDPTGKLPDDYFSEDHFGESGRDTNLVAHARTAKFPVKSGGTAFHVGEIQSDAAQSLREKNKRTGEVKKYSPRTRDEEIQLQEYDYLSRKLHDEVRQSENDLNKIIFADNVSMAATARRREHPEKLETYRTIIADFKNYNEATNSYGDKWKPDHTFFNEANGNIDDMSSDLQSFAQYIKGRQGSIPEEYTAWADSYIQNTTPKIDALSSGLKRFDNQDFSRKKTGAPFIENTDSWVNMVLKRQLMDAIESGVDYITLPNPDMVKQYTFGDLEGHRAFYGEIAPSNLLDIAKSYDPDAQLVGKLIETSEAVQPVTALPLTRRLVESIMEKGIPTYAVPMAVGMGYGALDELGEK